MDNRHIGFDGGYQFRCMVEQTGLEPADPAYWRQSLPLLLHVHPARIALGHLSVKGEPLLTGCGLYYSARRSPTSRTPGLEGKAGFEPTASRCAAGVLPEAPLAHDQSHEERRLCFFMSAQVRCLHCGYRGGRN